MAEWADTARQLSPEASAEPGRWRNARAPHLVEPMNALSPHDPCQEIALKFCAQSGKTEVILNFIGYIMDQDPGPILAIQPNQKPMGEAFSKDRIGPMLRDTPVLTSKVAAPKSRDGANTIFHKVFAGGHLTIGGANSPAGLASRPIRYLLADELDRWEVTKEGHALPLARKRTRTFHNRKILKVSSPTYDNAGIDAEYQAADQQFELHLTCPDCGESQMPKFKHFDLNRLDVDKSKYVCEHCGVAHGFDIQARLKAKAHWVQVKNDGWRAKGFWMNQWASPFATWAETILEFLDAKDDPEKLRVVVNTAFAEGWVEAGESIDETGLMARREAYTPQALPEAIKVLVAGVDVQDDRLELEVVGYAEGEQSWGVEYRVIYGDPARPDVWRDLDAVLSQTYTTTAGDTLGIAATAVDSGGHHTQTVYEYCQRRRARRIYAIKGAGAEGHPITKPTAYTWGNPKRKVRGFAVGTDQGKRLLFARLRIPDPGPGYCHFPNGYTEEYFLMLTAEKAVTKFLRGFAKREWIKTRPRNEALDIRVYAHAALVLLNPVWSRLQPGAGAKRKPKKPKPPPPNRMLIR